MMFIATIIRRTSSPSLFAAFGAEALHEVVNPLKLKAFGISHDGDMRVAEAEGLVAGLAVEVAMQFLDAALVVVRAEAVLRRAASVLDLVHQVMLREEGQSPENRGLVHALERIFQVAHAEGVVKLLHRPEHQGAHRRRLHPVKLHNFFSVKH